MLAQIYEKEGNYAKAIDHYENILSYCDIDEKGEINEIINELKEQFNK